jgi:hypothetical protein
MVGLKTKKQNKLVIRQGFDCHDTVVPLLITSLSLALGWLLFLQEQIKVIIISLSL